MKQISLKRLLIVYNLILILVGLISFVSFMILKIDNFIKVLLLPLVMFIVILTAFNIANKFINEDYESNKKDLNKLLFTLILTNLLLSIIGYLIVSRLNVLPYNEITSYLIFLPLMFLIMIPYKNLNIYQVKEVVVNEYDVKGVWTDKTEVKVHEPKKAIEILKEEESVKEVLSPIKIKSEEELKQEKNQKEEFIKANNVVPSKPSHTNEGTIAFHGFGKDVVPEVDDKVEVKLETKLLYPSNDEEKLCQNCGAKLKNDAKTCFMCGHAVE